MLWPVDTTFLKLQSRLFVAAIFCCGHWKYQYESTKPEQTGHCTDTFFAQVSIDGPHHGNDCFDNIA